MSVDEYSLISQQIQNLLQRRQAVTTTYLSVTTVLAGVMAFLFKDGQPASLLSLISILILLVSGIIACTLWRKQITQYSILTGWWYEQLRTLEEAAPESKKFAIREYEDLYSGKKEKALGLTQYEQSLTWLFTGIYIAFGCSILIITIFHL